MAANSFFLLSAHAVLFSIVSQLISVAHATSPALPPKNTLDVLFQWRYMDYTWSSREDRQQAIHNGTYIPENCIPLGLEYYKGRHFISTPRNRPGVPATYSTLSNQKSDGQYLLKPFPDFEHNREGNCKGFTSVYVPNIDEAGRLWIIDSAVVNVVPTLKPLRICKPKIVIYNLEDKDKLLGIHYVPEELLHLQSVLQTITVDIRYGRLDDAYAYISDVFANVMIVFSLKTGKFHSVSHPTFYPVPKYLSFEVNGTTVINPDGPANFPLGDVVPTPDGRGDRRVYYHAFSGVLEYYVMASTIQDYAAFSENPNSYPEAFYTFPTKRKSRTPMEVYDNQTGIMFFNQVTLDAIYCWNTRTDYYMANYAPVAQNSTTMQYVLGTKISGRNIFALSSRIQRFLQIHNMIDVREVNFRLLSGNIDRLIKGTLCEPSCFPSCTHSYSSQSHDFY